MASKLYSKFIKLLLLLLRRDVEPRIREPLGGLVFVFVRPLRSEMRFRW